MQTISIFCKFKFFNKLDFQSPFPIAVPQFFHIPYNLEAKCLQNNDRYLLWLPWLQGSTWRVVQSHLFIYSQQHLTCGKALKRRCYLVWGLDLSSPRCKGKKNPWEAEIYTEPRDMKTMVYLWVLKTEAQGLRQTKCKGSLSKLAKTSLSASFWGAQLFLLSFSIVFSFAKGKIWVPVSTLTTSC